MTNKAEIYEHIHYVNSLDRADEQDLRMIIRTFPIIDNHAHNFLRQEQAYDSRDFPFESITSEAQGHALHDHTYSSLAFIRGINQLADLFACRPQIQDIKAARNGWIRRDYIGLIQKCLAGTHALLIDDGLSPEAVYPVSWHQQLVPTASRIARIEAIAADLLEQLASTSGLIGSERKTEWDEVQSENLLVRFNTTFRNHIRTLAKDPHVRGFKSVVCYRTGLDVGLGSRNVFRPHESLTQSSLLASFHEFLQRAVKNQNYRIEQKEFNDYLVVAVCEILEKLVDIDGETVPIQFHTGLGDTDIDLVKANPAYMKPLITAFPNVDFVLLHAAYPYTKEAGYLATTFANAWLDIGLIFPMLSRSGQESALEHALQLTPTSKLLWSTDGHLHPETFYLANRQFRTALEKILLEYTKAGDLSIAQAINAAVDILFWNSNQLYKLDEERKYPQLLRACGRSGKTSTAQAGLPDTAASFGSSITTTKTLVTPDSDSASVTDKQTHSLDRTTMAGSADQDVAVLDAFLKTNPLVKYIWVVNVDYTGTPRLRMIPITAFRKHLTDRKYPGITAALPDLMVNDLHAPGVQATGELKMVPDLTSLCLNTVISSPSATIHTWWMDGDGRDARNHHYACPRWALQKHLDALKAEFDLTMLMGFEIEICFVRPSLSEDKSAFTGFAALNTVHSWSNLTHQDLDTLPMIEEIVESLAAVDIKIDQFHPENAPGQWEFPLPAFEPVKAIDTLYKAREIIRWVAHKHGLKATLYPRPYNFACGSSSHTHFSINGSSETVRAHSNSFLAGLLDNLTSIVAFSLPLEESYARVTAGIWAGGEYVCWGTQNREVPLRQCGPAHWELKTVDGIGNMYLSMAALVASGLYGLRKKLELTHKDNLLDASDLSPKERESLGITTKLPKKLDESLNSLNDNEILREMMGDKLIDGYIALKREESSYYNTMSDEERRIYLMARY